MDKSHYSRKIIVQSMLVDRKQWLAKTGLYLLFAVAMYVSGVGIKTVLAAAVIVASIPIHIFVLHDLYIATLRKVKPELLDGLPLLVAAILNMFSAVLIFDDRRLLLLLWAPAVIVFVVLTFGIKGGSRP